MEQINEAAEQKKTGGSRLKKSSKKPKLIVGGIAAALAAAYVGLCAYAGSLDTFYPNYHINGVEVGGLTAAEAQEKLETELPAQEITLYDAETQEDLTSITVADLGYEAESFSGDAQSWMDNQTQAGFLTRGWNYLMFLTGRWSGGWHWPDTDGQVSDATAARLSLELAQEPIHTSYKLGEDSILLTRAKDGRSVSSGDLTPLRDISAYQDTYRFPVTFTVRPAEVLTAQEIYDQVSGEVKNAGYDKETDSITPEKAGAEFDAKAAQAALDAIAPGETVTVPAQVQLPAVTAKQLEAVLFRDVLGEARTHVSGTAARISNVKLSAATINDYVMNSGDVFSYNGVVGQRTAENGYKPAPAYVKGETVDEIGGGICQTSSTLYLACLRGNIAITERYAHRYVPAYIGWGMDATVSWGGPDYKFTNDTNYPIKIVTEYKNNYLTVKLLGTNEQGISAKVTNQVLSTTPWETVYEVDETLAPGTPESVKTTPYTGYKVQTFHTIYDKDGKVIDSHYEATSDYKVRHKVILQAPSAAPVPDVPAFSPEDLPAEMPEAPSIPETPAEPAPVPAEPEVPDVPEAGSTIVVELPGEEV